MLSFILKRENKSIFFVEVKGNKSRIRSWIESQILNMNFETQVSPYN